MGNLKPRWRCSKLTGKFQNTVQISKYWSRVSMCNRGFKKNLVENNLASSTTYMVKMINDLYK